MINMRASWIKLFTAILPVFLLCQTLTAQKGQASLGDTLKLEDVIAMVLENNPVIKQSGEMITTSSMAIEMAKSAYLPTLALNSSYSIMAPIPSFTIPDFGHVQLYPDNSLNFTFEAHELVYDFGKTKKSVSMQKINSELASLSVEQIKEKYALASARIFYTIYYLQSSKDIVGKHLNTLKKHLEFVENKQKTGSATDYEILSTRVNVSVAETQFSELQTNYNVQVLHLATLIGHELENVYVEADTSAVQKIEIEDSTFTFAQLHRDDIVMQTRKQQVAEMNYQFLQAQKYPTLSMFGTGGWKNGYLPEIEMLKPNYLVGISLQVPIFDGNRKNIKLKMASSSINQTKYESENTQLTAFEEIKENYLQLQLSQQKIIQSQIQVQQAQEAYYHAELNFKEGVITNLDLIYATDMLANSQLQLLKNKIDYRLNVLKYKVSVGERIY
jgi:outer membrane protein